MSIRIRYKITCTQCGKPAPDRGAETEEEAIGYAADDGWNQHRVPNGSLWEFCPECWQRFRSEANDTL
jgi:hypothetical protein